MTSGLSPRQKIVTNNIFGFWVVGRLYEFFALFTTVRSLEIQRLWLKEDFDIVVGVKD